MFNALKQIFFLLIIANQVFSQNIDHENYFDLRENANINAVSLDKKYFNIQDYPSNNLNYVKTLLLTWKLIKTKKSDSVATDNLKQALSAVGDIKSISLLNQNEMPLYPQLNDTAYLNGFKRAIKKRKIISYSATDYILKKFEGQKIIMFNEGHDRPQTRAFVLSMLEDFKKVGVTCLAMETFAQFGNLKNFDGSTGLYCQEPVSGQIVREALRLGFKLIPYEDFNLSVKEKTLQGKDTIVYVLHTPNQRDSAQAANLYSGIKNITGIEKTLVLAGYGHIAETWSDSSFSTMAMNFKKNTGINPLTIDQTALLEEMPNHPYGKRILDKLTNNDSIKAYQQKDLQIFGESTTSYDISIYHPSTKYLHNRPSWLLSKDKSFINVEIPKSLKPVLVQAYVNTEIKNDNDFNLKVPFDQTFYSENNKAWLVLRKKTKFIIVFRDEKNKIIQKKEING